MKAFARLSFAAFATVLTTFAFASTNRPAPVSSISGLWLGTATVRGQQIPVRLQICGDSDHLQAALLNGPERSPASSVRYQDGKLLISFNYFARTLQATVADGQLTGIFGLTSHAPHGLPPVPLVLRQQTEAASSAPGPDIQGDWEIAVTSNKGESAWLLRVQPEAPASIRAVIQRIDGDTGSLYGSWDGHQYTVSHFTAAGVALYAIAPQADGTLRVSNLIASEAVKAQSTNLVARRPAQARKENLAAPTDSAEQTRMKDPSARLTFSFPDLSGNRVSSSDPRFQDKVVIVTIGGSWCPN